MKRPILSLICIVLASSAFSSYAQVAPSAEARRSSLTAGGFASAFQPDYAGNGISQSSPNPLIGVGTYVDYKFNRWVALEGEANWGRFNQYIGINEDTYLIGPKIPIKTFGGFTPYGKVLVGLGTGSYLSGHSTVLAYGGGVDYRLSRRFSLRMADFEFQQWFLTPTLYPYGGSVGIAYRIF